MAVRKYKTKSIQAAITMIKKDMGPDAMILSTRRISGGIHDPYGNDLFEVAASSEPPPPSGPGEKENNTPSLRGEIETIKEMLSFMADSRGLPSIFLSCPKSLKLYTKLISVGISEDNALNFIDRLSKTEDGKRPEIRELAKRVVEDILKSIQPVNPFEFKGVTRKNKCHAFIGPTGVGKTTTIAKLAADLSLKQKIRVGLISIDSYRIGAVEQLKTYAAIMGLPFFSAFNRDDMEKATKSLENQDLVLIDTAGQSHLDSKKIQELEIIMKTNPGISTHLVLSATTKQKDLMEAEEHFKGLTPQTCVFTKFDETRQGGTIINHALETRLPISFLTNGQRVPEDIMPGTRRNLARLVFGL